MWIYHFEQHSTFGKAAGRVIEELEAGRFRGIASELTLLEIIVKPLQLGRQDAADDYETLLSYFPNLELNLDQPDYLARCGSIAGPPPPANTGCDSARHGLLVGCHFGDYK